MKSVRWHLAGMALVGQLVGSGEAVAVDLPPEQAAQAAQLAASLNPDSGVFEAAVVEAAAEAMVADIGAMAKTVSGMLKDANLAKDSGKASALSSTLSQLNAAQKNAATALAGLQQTLASATMDSADKKAAAIVSFNQIQTAHGLAQALANSAVQSANATAGSGATPGSNVQTTIDPAIPADGSLPSDSFQGNVLGDGVNNAVADPPISQSGFK